MVLKAYLKILLNVLFYATDISDNFTLADELFAKGLGSFETSVIVNKDLCKKLFSSFEQPTTFDESFKVTSEPFINLICELDNFMFKVLY